MTAERRRYLLDRAARIDGLPVNCKWQLQTSDPDLKHLLKKGKLKLVRRPTTGGGTKSSAKRQTYAVLTGQG